MGRRIERRQSAVVNTVTGSSLDSRACYALLEKENKEPSMRETAANQW